MGDGIWASRWTSRRVLLSEAFSHHYLQIVFHNRQFVLTCLAKADEMLGTYIYDVNPFPEARDREWLNRLLVENTSGQWEDVDGVGGTLDLIGSDDWQIGGLLIVRQSEKVHEEISEVLDQLRKPLEIPVKEIEPTQTRSIYALPDATTAADLQKMLPVLIRPPGVTWPPSCFVRVGSTLFVTQTEAVHHRIERLIEAMDKARKTAKEAKDTLKSPPTNSADAPVEKK